MIVVTHHVPDGFDAITVWPFVFIRPECLLDSGLIEHERVHLREQACWRVLPWWALYLCSRRFRLAAEVRAYRRQIAVGGISLSAAASMLLNYRTGVTYTQAKLLLGN